MVTPERQHLSPGAAPGEDTTDAELILRSLEDPRAFMPIVDRHQRVLFGYLARRLGRDAAEDITSETFTRAFALRERYDTTRPDARPWLFGIATNLLRNQARSEGRRLRAYQRHGADDRVPSEEDGAAARADADRASGAIARALEQLKPGDRDALLMFAWQDMAYEEIAEALDIPVGTVRSRLNRARRIVVDHLQATGAIDAAGTLVTKEVPGGRR